MFNRSAFNQTPFNRYGGADVFLWSGTGQGVTTGILTAYLKAVLGGEGDAISTGILVAVGDYLLYGETDGISTGTGRQIRLVYLYGDADAISTGEGGGLYAVGTDFITLNTILNPGDVVRIDTDKMTVTVNNINAVQYLSDDSVFFLLAAGDQVDFGVSGSADVVFLWKDRWL